MSDVPGGPTPPPPPPPPMMGGPGGGIPPKTLGQILSAAFNVYRANATGLITIVALVVIPLSFVSSLLTDVVFDPGTGHITVLGERVEVANTRGFFAALAVAAIVVAGLITGAIGAILGALGGDNWVLRWAFSAIATVVTAPFSSLVIVLLYLDLRARGEALSADALRAELAASGR